MSQGFFCGYLVYDFIDNQGSFSLPLMAAVSFFAIFLPWASGSCKKMWQKKIKRTAGNTFIDRRKSVGSEN
jgi:hypothetical protein